MLDHAIQSNRLTMPRRLRRGRPNGYTLAEVLTVVVLLGILITVAFVATLWAVDDARKAAFVANMQTLDTAVHVYRAQKGHFPPAPGTPEGDAAWAQIIDLTKWQGETPIGGVWSIDDSSVPGADLAVGVHFNAVEDTEENEDVLQQHIYPGIEDIDMALDDGDPSTGRFIQVDSNKFYMVYAD